jgi:hypothetical protein
VDKLAETAVSRKVGTTRDIHERVVIDTVAFLCHVLATLEYKYDEPLRIVHKIDRRLGASMPGKCHVSHCLAQPRTLAPCKTAWKSCSPRPRQVRRSFARGVVIASLCIHGVRS